MNLSIIMPRYANTPEVAEACDRNLAQMQAVSQVSTEIIVIDNGSAFPTMQTPVTRYVQWLKNHGVAPAWNQGRRYATGRFLAFVTSSVWVEPGWDTALTAVADTGPYIAMPYTNGEKPYGGLGISGWCWVIRRGLAYEIGEFDETFAPAQFEDTEFYHRAIYEHGVELVNVPSAHVRRTGGRTHSVGLERFDYLHLANRYRYAWKHGVDPHDVPPFWKTPLRDVEAPVEAAAC